MELTFFLGWYIEKLFSIVLEPTVGLQYDYLHHHQYR